MIMKFDIKNWTLNGNKMVHPLVIVYRLVVIPVYVTTLMLFALARGLYFRDVGETKETLRGNL
jgi:hypothetical protein